MAPLRRRKASTRVSHLLVLQQFFCGPSEPWLKPAAASMQRSRPGLVRRLRCVRFGRERSPDFRDLLETSPTASAGASEPLSMPVVRYSKAGFVPLFRDLLGDPHSGECPPAKRSRKFARFGVVTGETATCVSGLRPPAGRGNKIETILKESGKQAAPNTCEQLERGRTKTPTDQSFAKRR